MKTDDVDILNHMRQNPFDKVFKMSAGIDRAKTGNHDYGFRINRTDRLGAMSDDFDEIFRGVAPEAIAVPVARGSGFIPDFVDFDFSFEPFSGTGAGKRPASSMVMVDRGEIFERGNGGGYHIA